MENCLLKMNPAPLLLGAKAFSRSALVTLLGLLLIGMNSWAQDRSIKGNVSDANNKPLTGATVSVKGKQVSTTTDLAGDFTIRASSNDVLVFTSVGYGGKEFKVGQAN